LILNMIALMERFTRGRADVTGPRMAGLLSSVLPPAVAGGMGLGEPISGPVGSGA